ncbi:MAG: hypothetical protein JO116_26180 [Planctomycetaceae bacterium]|nr:hypothetical protein [Planctomycetaceae bacterium]
MTHSIGPHLSLNLVCTWVVAITCEPIRGQARLYLGTGMSQNQLGKKNPLEALESLEFFWRSQELVRESGRSGTAPSGRMGYLTSSRAHQLAVAKRIFEIIVANNLGSDFQRFEVV